MFQEEPKADEQSDDLSLLWIGLPYFYNSASHILLGSNAADHNSTILAGFDYFNCGNSTESAKAMGCTYDILDNHWVPTQCIDEQAIEEYQSDGSWHGYADSEHKHMLSLAEMGERPVYWTSKRDHIVHCASLWIKQFNAFIEGRDQFDSLIVDSMHTKHCAKYLIDRTDEGEDFRKEPIQVEVGFAGCHIRRTR
ncbi:hypothetical protein TrVFT333_004722 [Trichoderma virens FT-333]|nr:hypothetical protein TrVFT333_004722 [Trichoderma virens FT-333]